MHRGSPSPSPLSSPSPKTFREVIQSNQDIKSISSLLHHEMSSGDTRRTTCEYINEVKKNIQHCLLLYLNRKEVMHVIAQKDGEVGRDVAELVWQNLEEQNGEFFKMYHLLLFLKEQIIFYNQLLVQQAQLMPATYSNGIAPLPRLSNPDLSYHRRVGNMPPSVYFSSNPINGRPPSLDQSMFLAGAASHVGVMNHADMFSTSNSHVGVPCAAKRIKTESSYPINFQNTFCLDGSYPVCPAIGDAPDSPSINTELNVDTSPEISHEIPLDFIISDAPWDLLVVGKASQIACVGQQKENMTKEADGLTTHSKAQMLKALEVADEKSKWAMRP